jgi:tellurite methyltransferase
MSAEDRERWQARWSERPSGPVEPEPFLVREAAGLSRPRLLDVAAGDGRNALWLAAQGFAVTAVDVAPAAIARLKKASATRGLAVDALVADLDAADALSNHDDLFDAVIVVRFRPSPRQWKVLLPRLRPSGRLLLCSFGAEQHRRRGFPLAFCLDRPTLERELTPGLRLLRWESFAQGEDRLEGSLWERPS